MDEIKTVTNGQQQAGLPNQPQPPTTPPTSNVNQTVNPNVAHGSSPANPELTIEDTNEDDSSPAKNVRSIISTIALFLAAPLLALVLILFVIQSYEVDGPSMEQTLQNQDLLIVNKLPRTMSRITRQTYIPDRGTIIIFSRDEGGLGSGSTRQLVKRVVGLPGERVTVKDGVVTVYNQEKPEGFNPDALNEFTKDYKDTAGNVDVTVQENEVFVMGDNRNNSLDSRYFGPVEAKEIVGELGMRIFPLNKARSF